MQREFEMNEEKISSIVESLRLLTDKQLDIIRGFVVNCVNKNLLDEIRSILEDNKDV
jgi:Asp/Glu/hydantoin racemase